jgi:hypothetical protein
VRTAELLGVSRNVIRTLLKRYGLLNDADGNEDGALIGGASQYFRSSRLPTLSTTFHPYADEHR